MTAIPLRALRVGPAAFRLRPRVLFSCLALAVLVILALTVCLIVGDYPIPLRRIPAALIGQGERLDVFFVREVRLPRALTAALVGAALGTAGAVFQSLSRNPLGSPDIIGFTAGASTGAVLTILVFGGGMLSTALGAMLGGVGTALLVYLLALRRGVQGYRLILVGIGISAMLGAVTHYLITRAELTDALSAQVWLVGTLNSREWPHVTAVGIGCAVLIPFLLWLGTQLRLMEMGEDTARALGVATQRTQTLALIAASALTGIAIAVSGPIAFVALAAPQLARRLTRANGTTLVASALMGAALLLCSDLVALRLLAPVQLPVGVVTTVVGGTYLVWLLYAEWRSGRA